MRHDKEDNEEEEEPIVLGPRDFVATMLTKDFALANSHGGNKEAQVKAAYEYADLMFKLRVIPTVH